MSSAVLLLIEEGCDNAVRGFSWFWLAVCVCEAVGDPNIDDAWWRRVALSWVRWDSGVWDECFGRFGWSRVGVNGERLDDRVDSLMSV